MNSLIERLRTEAEADLFGETVCAEAADRLAELEADRDLDRELAIKALDLANKCIAELRADNQRLSEEAQSAEADYNRVADRIAGLESDYKELARLRKAEAVDNLANEQRIKELEAQIHTAKLLLPDLPNSALKALGGDDGTHD